MALVCFICPTMMVLMMIIHWWSPPHNGPPPGAPPPSPPARPPARPRPHPSSQPSCPNLVTSLLLPQFSNHPSSSSSSSPSFFVQAFCHPFLLEQPMLLPGCLLLQRCNHYPYFCCWLLLPGVVPLFVCLLVRFVGIVYICFERRRRVARKKERKKERRESCLLCCCGGCLLASFPGFRCLCSSTMI